MDNFIEEQGLFWQYPVITEKTFYIQNKDDPTYIGIPWATIIDKRYNIKEIGEKIHEHISVKIGYTCCQHISFRKLIPLFRLLNIRTVFSPHKKVGECFIDGIEIKACPLYAVNVEDVSRQKLFLNVNYEEVERPLWFSFIGGYQKDYLTTVRERLFQKYASDTRKDILVKNSGDWHFNEVVYNRLQGKKGDENITNRHITNTEVYNRTLLQSRYSLCPSGTGPNSIRFWESLAVGAIPVLMSNSLELPQNDLWDDAIVIVSEDNIELLEEKLLSITLEREKELRKKGIALYHYYKNNYKGGQYYLMSSFSREQKVESFEKIQKVIECAELQKKPYFIGRVSYNEASLCGQLLAGKQPDANLRYNMLWVAGIQFKGPMDIRDYVKAYTSAINECDIVGIYDTLMYSHIIDFHMFMVRFMYKKSRFCIEGLEPYRYMDEQEYRFADLLENKRILIITSHADTVQQQIDKKKMYHKKSIFPESASLQVYRSVQQNGKSNDEQSWKVHLEKMKEDLRVLSKTDPYDVVIAGCGGFGMILSNFLHKELSKSVIYIGGALQLFFGIKGNRWREDIEYTEDWVESLDSDKPVEPAVCELGCYWCDN
tara:strand:- start:3389 stop:5188 length:1800 start_codon:yes stop_codon:yes gene_type:complete